MEFFFMFIGLGFFLFCMKLVLHESDTEYQRKLNEQREFGYRPISRDPPSQETHKHKK